MDCDIRFHPLQSKKFYMPLPLDVVHMSKKQSKIKLQPTQFLKKCYHGLNHQERKGRISVL